MAPAVFTPKKVVVLISEEAEYSQNQSGHDVMNTLYYLRTNPVPSEAACLLNHLQKDFLMGRKGRIVDVANIE